MPAVSAYGGRLSIGGTFFRINNYSIDWRCDPVDTSYFNNGTGYEEWTMCLTGADVSVDAHWRTEDNPFTAPLNLQPGLFLHNITLFLNLQTDPGAAWQFPQVQVLNCKMQASVRDTIRYTMNFRGTAFSVLAPIH